MASAKLAFSLRGLPAMAAAELGAPATSTEYRICIYDETSTAVQLAVSLSVPPGASWKTQNDSSLAYGDHSGAHDGIKRITITPAAADGARVKLSAGGSALPLPGAALADRYFVKAPAVTVQVVNDAGGCWAARFTEAIHDDATRFVARSEHEQPPVAGKHVFVSSTCFDGALGGVAIADAQCQALADAAGLTGSFRAWLADRSAAPATRFDSSALPYLRTDGALVAHDWSDLIDGVIDAPIVLDEAGMPIDPIADCGTSVWTNVAADGAVAIADGYEFVCQDWTSNLAARSALTGNASLTGAGWTDGGAFATQSCDRRARLYCFEQ